MLDAREGRAQGRGPEQYAAYNLADRARLPEPREQGTHAVRGQQEDSQRDQQPGKISVCEGQCPYLGLVSAGTVFGHQYSKTDMRVNEPQEFRTDAQRVQSGRYVP